MKYLFLLLALTSLSGCAIRFIPNEIEGGKLLGVMPMKYNNAQYQLTKPVQGNREEIFRQARRWAAFNLPSAATALSVSDNMIGDVMVTRTLERRLYRVKNRPRYLPSCSYAISIESMEGYYRATASNIRFNPTKEFSYGAEYRIKGSSKKQVREHLDQIDKDIKDMLADLEAFVPGEILKQITP